MYLSQTSKTLFFGVRVYNTHIIGSNLCRLNTVQLKKQVNLRLL